LLKLYLITLYFFLSPLHYACGVGNLAAVKRILESQAEVDAQVN